MVTIERAAGRLTFDRVDFSYKTRTDTLKDISFEARSGETLAIVGATGAGKTTLVNLIPRFLDPWEGRVLIDGCDVRDGKRSVSAVRRWE